MKKYLGKDITIKKYLHGLLIVVILSIIILSVIFFLNDRFFPHLSIPLKQSCFYTLSILIAIIAAEIATRD